MWQYRVSGCPCGESGNTDDSEGANKATGGLRNGKMQQMSQVFVELSLFVRDYGLCFWTSRDFLSAKRTNRGCDSILSRSGGELD